MTEKVPKSDLEELVERWRETGQSITDKDSQTDYGFGLGEGMKRCAMELEEAVLEE